MLSENLFSLRVNHHTEGLGVLSQKTRLLGGVAQILIYPTVQQMWDYLFDPNPNNPPKLNYLHTSTI